MPTVLLRLNGMRGPDDEERVRTALLAEPGVYGAVVSCEDGCAEVDIEDDVVSVDRIIEIIETAGFPAVLAG